MIAPQSLIATAISIGSVMCWIFGLGLGSILSGFLVDSYGIRIMLYVVGVAGICFFLFYLVLYHLVIKRFEVNQNLENQDDERDQKTEENGDGNVLSTRL